jgi:hypothetical protein
MLIYAVFTRATNTASESRLNQAFITAMTMAGKIAAVACAMTFAVLPRAQAFVLDDDSTNAAANMGERLFLETRFAEFFFTNSGGNANVILPNITNVDYSGGEVTSADGNTNAIFANGDPVMNHLKTIYGPQPGPFAGTSMNCRECHLVNEMQDTLGNRTYCDFAPRSPIPHIGDGRVQTPRNAPTLVNALLPRGSPLFLHFDGQFTTPQDLIITTLTGRNYGWKPTEYATAIHHIANIIRYDDGKGALAQSKYGGGYPYSLMFQFPPGQISTLYRLNYQYWLGDLKDTNPVDPLYVSDETIVQTVATLIEQYLDTLVFSQDTNGNFNGSPYDVFLIKNGLPQRPTPGEPPLHYSQRLLGLIEGLSHPQYVTDPADGEFVTLPLVKQTFRFGPLELEGLKIFFRTNADQMALSQPPVISIARLGGNVAISWTPPDGTLLGSPNSGLSAVWTPLAVNSPVTLPMGNSNAYFRVVVPRTGRTAGRTGNCVACHAPPDFTDFLFHNTGAAQEEYDSIHGAGSFNKVCVPDLAERENDYDAYLPPTANHPNATGRFITPPAQNKPGEVDLGLWNVFDNPDFPAPQAGLQQILPGLIGDTAASPDDMLRHTIALFKTPAVRDLGQSEPYLHTGRMDTVEKVIQFYQNFSAKARDGNVRNAAPELRQISLDSSAVTPLAAFLRSLNEDYTD